jgi:hypothetical protein
MKYGSDGQAQTQSFELADVPRLAYSSSASPNFKGAKVTISQDCFERLLVISHSFEEQARALPSSLPRVL